MFGYNEEDSARLLDERIPGWHQRINLDVLDIMNPCACVLGQLYRKEACEVGMNAYRYGKFKLFGNPNLSSVDEPLLSGFVGRTEKWKELIQDRLEIDKLEKEANQQKEEVLI